MIDERRVLAGVPVRLVTKTTAPKGAVIFYHGFMSSIDQQSKELLSLASKNYLAVGVDAVGHGKRRYSDFDDRFLSENPDHHTNYIQLLQDSVKELPGLVDVLLEEGLAKLDRLALTGISMGGYICFGASLAEPRIKVLLPILGSPVWQVDSSQSPHTQLNSFYPRAMLVQNAGLDTNVPPDAARSFIDALRPKYHEDPERLQYYEFPQSSHFMREDDWNELWQNALDWLDRWFQ
jgi:uncharacterized protein